MIANTIMRLVATTPPEAGVVLLRNARTGKCLTVPTASGAAGGRVMQQHCGFDSSHRPNNPKQWFHVLQSAPFIPPTEPSSESASDSSAPGVGYFYIIPANVIAGSQDSWKLTLNSTEMEDDLRQTSRRGSGQEVLVCGRSFE